MNRPYRRYRRPIAALLLCAAAVAGAAQAADTDTVPEAVPETGNGCAKPAYPRHSLRNGEQGTVRLAALVDADGTVRASKLEKGSGHRGLDQAAQQALSDCKFKSASQEEKAEPTWTRIEYVWKLD